MLEKNEIHNEVKKDEVSANDVSMDVEKVNPFQRVVNSFKPHPNRNIFSDGGHLGEKYDIHIAMEETAESPLSRTLKSRHLQMIAIGGAIGTGLFVGSGSALATGGPANLLIAFFLTGMMLFCTVHSLGEMAVLFPVSGSYSVFATRFVDPAWGFAMSWNYAIGWLINLPLELVAASITIQFWQPGVSNAVFVTIFLLLIVGINMFGARGYGEAEFVFSFIKIIAVVGFIILGIVLNAGGGPNGEYIGGKYWHNPGAFNNGFKGLCSVFVTAAFSFSGTEMAGLAAAETEDPRKTLPKATKQVFWRITLFYMVSITIVGLLVPYTDPQLLNSESSVDIKASPFVIAINNAKIPVLPSIMNTVILISVLSVGNSSVYGSTRILCSLAEQGQAPRILAYIDRKGRPMVAVAIALTVGLLSYLAVLDDYSTVFNWLLAISGLSGIFAWFSINVSHIRFRRGWKVQGHTLDQLPFKSVVGVFGSYLGATFNALVLAAQFWIALFPIGGSPDAADFFMSYLAFPVCILFYIVFKIVKRTSFVSASQMDIVTGRRHLMTPEDWQEEAIEKQSWSRLKRIYRWWC
jgi:amino acid transporter